MIANEMANRLEILVDRTSSSSSPGYENEEFSILLTKAMHQFIKQTISPLTNLKRQGLEESEIRNQGLSNLVKNAVIAPSSSTTAENLPNGQFVDLPSDFMFTLSELATANQLIPCDPDVFTTCSVDVISHNDYSKLVKSPYRKPFIKNGEGLVWRMQIGRTTDGSDILGPGNTEPDRTVKRHELITDGTFGITSYKFRYLKFPPEIVVDFDDPSNQKNCILDDATHESIVEIAAAILRTSTDRQTMPNIAPIQNFE